MSLEQQSPLPKKRIGSIDALRAFALLGIVTVHAVGRFCVSSSYFDLCVLDKLVILFSGAFLENRCATIFAMLFGVSFYIILKKPNYPTSRFVWRCFLLMCIGLINKLFYRADALMLYGICGMILALFRSFSNKQLLITAFLLYLGGYVMSISSLSETVVPYISQDIVRYGPSHTFMDVIAYWPQSVLWYLEHTLHGGCLTVLAKFTLGYWIGRKGFVEIMDEKISLKLVLISLAFYVLFFASFELLDYYSELSFPLFILKQAKILSGSIFYAIGFIWVYNHCNKLKTVFHQMEDYGKLGLTNYSFQGICLVFILSDLGLAFHLGHIYYIVIIAWIFYLIQVVFSTFWLKKFRNGPLEYLWRCATNFEWLPFRNS